MSVAEARRMYWGVIATVAFFEGVCSPGSCSGCTRLHLMADAASIALDLAYAQQHAITGLRARQEAVWTARAGGAA